MGTCPSCHPRAPSGAPRSKCTQAELTTMREHAPLSDFQAYQTPEFSHAEVLEITGLTADTLLTWHKRGVIVGSEGSQALGRGHRRKYSEFEVVRLAIMKHLAPTMALP